ncbi:uncharacterized protein [Aegilops tauschii subsp. strangulata]|uniref:uncharacterized protein n=1 Tax=Aegilops tauschii subsp. strangulata TaxID=200361 RepID=UPI00084298C0|nr:auxin response factor 5 [Aegilops tauschii subsp. strangulata]
MLMGSNEADKPLRRIGASFEQLAAVAKQQQQPAMAAGDFSRACSNVSVLFCCLDIAFKFAEMDYVAKASGRSSAPSPPPLPALLFGRGDHQQDTQLPHPELPYPSLPSQLMCQVHNITMHADKDNEEVYAQMTLQPINSVLCVLEDGRGRKPIFVELNFLYSVLLYVSFDSSV